MFRLFFIIFKKIAAFFNFFWQNSYISAKTYPNKKNMSRQNQQKLIYKIRPRNRISKNVMEICGDGNSKQESEII